MIKSIVLVSLVIGQISYAKEASDPTPEKCLSAFARNYVPEANNPNDSILSTDKKDMLGALDVIASADARSWVSEFAKSNLKYADAVGVVFNYQDEIHMIYASIEINGGKCQVKELTDINTVDVEENKDKTLLEKYFLSVPQTKLPETARDWVYPDIKNKLNGIVE